MGVRADPGSFRWCQALSRSRSFATTNQLFYSIASLFFVFIFIINIDANLITPGQDAVHITAILGESVVFNCHVEFPGDHPVPYVLQWEKKVSETGQEIPIYIWYESYPTHSGEGYEGRVSRVSSDSPFGAASLNLTNIRETDQGWYECKVVFLNRSPNQHKNGTWFHLDVHAPPRFSVTPEDIIYVNLGDSIILNCQADGTPTPEILWYKDANPVVPSSTVGIFNDGTELRISTIRHEDIGDYTCIARNGEGQVSHTARVIIAGGAVIMVPPTNQTKLEGEKVQFTCEAKAMPGNVTVRWFREGAPVREVAALETRVTIRKDGSLIINPVSADDSGQYTCEVSNGIGEPQSAAAFLNVEYPAKVTFTPTIQYLPFRLAGVVQCYIKANPPLQYVTWTKDKRLLEPYQTKDIVIMNNGSLLFTRVNQNHQGRYTCTPYNAQGTQGSSGHMEVLVRKPPVFTIEPEPLYQRKVGEVVEMHCEALEAEGTSKPNIQWQRRDGTPLQRNRVKVSNGNITIENLRRSDFGYYQCIASNEVATIISATQLVIEGTQPHAPYNLTGTATEFAVTLSWLPGYSGGPDYKQDYTIWYREAGVSDWSTIPVTPSGSTSVTINRLSPGTTYEYQVIGKNALGDGMMSKVITVRTLEVSGPRKVTAPQQSTVAPSDFVFRPMPDEADIINYNNIMFPTDSTGSTYFPPIFRPTGPKPGTPRNLTVTEIANGFLITWQVPLERAHLIQFYTIKYRTDAQWKTLNRGQIRPEETSYLVKNLVGGRTYYFRVLANSLKSYESSDEVKFPVPARVKHKAITAGVVGGILFFIVAIILSICAVKICNKRKRRKQEKALNMVACRITDARNAALSGGGGIGGSVIGTVSGGGSGGLGGGGGKMMGVSGISRQVPLKKYREGRIPGINLLIALLQWIWPSGRCHNCNSIYSTTLHDDHVRNLEQIHRAADGRFILNDGSIQLADELLHAADSKRGSLVGSQYSSSDDGGFLPPKRRRAMWRRPIVAYPSQLSFHSDASAQSHAARHLFAGQSRLGNIGGRLTHLLRTVPELHSVPLTENLHINTISANVPGPMVASIYSPSRISRVHASSPATSSPLAVNSPWSPLYFSDLSSVHPSSAERSFPTPQSALSQQRYYYDRYYNELPSLQVLHEETKRMTHGFVPVHIPMTASPSSTSRNYYQNIIPQQQMLYHGYRPRVKLFPRQQRGPRSLPELASPSLHLTTPMSLNAMETSPESRSSSSGFGSKNTSTQQNQSSQSGGTVEWQRYLPPYRPPPPPPNSYQHQHHHHHHYHHSAIGHHPQHAHAHSLGGHQSLPPPTPPYSMSNWLEFITRLNAASEKANLNKAVDVGSVDGHYEFDPATPTPTASTPTGGPRDDLNSTTTTIATITGVPSGGVAPEPLFSPNNSGSSGNNMSTFQRVKRPSRYDNIDARVQAMKEEFQAFRNRQANKSGVELESAC